MPRKKRS